MRQKGIKKSYITQYLKAIRPLLLFVTGLLVANALIWRCGYNSKTEQNNFTLQSGDLLFQDLDGSPFYEAVEKVTQGYNDAALTHVGIVASNGKGEIIVIEAISKGVTETPLDTFLNRSHDNNGRPKVLVGRLLPQYRHLIKTALAEALNLNGKPYDSGFDIQNDAYYCSELVYFCFKEANDGQPLFELQPMTFIDPDTKETFPAWREYFRKLGIDVPEGKPGLNPGSISRSPVLRIVHKYGFPDGWKVK